MSWWKRESKTGSAAATSGPVPLIRLEGITKIFEGEAEETGSVALRQRHAWTSIAASTVSVSGPSGCGKSTFLSILALLDRPRSGGTGSTGARSIG